MSSIWTSIGKGIFIGVCGFMLDFVYTFNNKYKSIYDFICDCTMNFSVKENEQSCLLSLINNNSVKNFIIITPLAYTIVDYNYINHYNNFNIIKYVFIILIQSTIQRFIMKEMERSRKNKSNYFTSLYNNLLVSYPALKKNTYTYFYVVPTMISCYIVKPSELTTIVSVMSILTLNHPYNKTTIDNLIILYNMIKDASTGSYYCTIDTINTIDTVDTIENEDNIDNNGNENNSKEEFDTTININVAYQIGEELISNDDYVILDN